MNPRARKAVLLILVFLACANVFAWYRVIELAKPKFLSVIFFDIGQGDAIFIETPKGKQILIDGGPSSKILEKLKGVMPFYDRTLDLIVLTHPEKDHIAGLLEVLEKYKVKNILWTGSVRDTSEWLVWEDLIKKEGACVKIAQAGLRVVLDNRRQSVVFEVLYPFEALEGRKIEDSNNTSIVGRLDFGQISFLFTGDIEKTVEEKLVDRTVQAEILKIPHHGSKSSSSEAFLKAVSAEEAVIQAGRDNPYGHPHQEVLARIQDFGIEIRRTDEDGDIKIISDGTLLKVVSNQE